MCCLIAFRSCMEPHDPWQIHLHFYPFKTALQDMTAITIIDISDNKHCGRGYQV